MSEDSILKEVVSSCVPLKFKKLHPDAKIPQYAKEGDAGLDLVATSHEATQIGEKWYVYDAFLHTYGFGLAVEIPPGFVGLIFPRSSIFKTNLMLSNAVGVIDSGYRGELKAVFRSTRFLQEVYKVGDRCAQLVIMELPRIRVEEVSELSETARGIGGFGSTGK